MKGKYEEHVSTDACQQNDQSHLDMPVLNKAQPNNCYDLRPRWKINYTEETEGVEPIARTTKAIDASTLLQVSLMLSLGVTMLASKNGATTETIRSIKCVPGRVHLSSSDSIPYEVCAEIYCVHLDNPRFEENVSFRPYIILNEHLVQWKFGEKLNTIETLCPSFSFCLTITSTFCSSNILNPECWPLSAILATATLLYFNHRLLRTAVRAPSCR